MADLLSRRDLEFQLYEVLDTEALCQRARCAEHSRATFDQIMDAAKVLAQTRFRPHWKTVDVAEPTFDGHRVHPHPAVKEALDAYVEAGCMVAGHSPDRGGLQLPCVVEKAAFAHFKAANGSTAGYALLTGAAVNLILAHGTPAQIEQYAEPMPAGRFFGTMALSETQAGSSLADITTRAVPGPDGTYRLFGSKMWISAGDHELSENIVHLVMAKIEGAPAGVRGISLFIVPKYLMADDGTLADRTDVCIGGLNHKMGSRGTVNPVFNLGEGKFRPLGSAGAVGTNTNLIHLGTALAAGVTALVETTDRLVACPDPERGLANAFPYLTVFGHTVVGWLWVEQALAAQRGLEASPGDRFYLGKLAAARYFLDWVLAATQPTHQLLRRLDETPLSMQPEWY